MFGVPSISSSSLKNINEETDFRSLESLPDDILLNLCCRVADTSVTDASNLQSVSKNFNRLCNDRYVFQRFPLYKFPLYLWSGDKAKYCKFVKTCRKYGNLEAIYRKGCHSYFHLKSSQKQQEKGFKYLATAAEKGHEQAKYIYGFILLCLGGETKENGYKLLASLKKPLMADTIKGIEKLRQMNKTELWWNGDEKMTHFKAIYSREICNCDGRTGNIYNWYYSDWHRLHSNNEDLDMSSSDGCDICLTHLEVDLLLK